MAPIILRTAAWARSRQLDSPVIWKRHDGISKAAPKSAEQILAPISPAGRGRVADRDVQDYDVTHRDGLKAANPTTE